MSRRCVAVTVALLSALTLSAVSLGARQTPTPKVKVVAFGGFLGFVDGLYELPAGKHDTTPAGPAGGLVGVRRLLDPKDPRQRDEKYANALRLVTGNNMPRYAGPRDERPTSPSHPFWPLLASVSPAAVAFGTQDLAHALSETDGASHLAQLMQRRPRTLPFIVSNVFIKSKAPGMNAVRQGAYELEVPADEALGLLRRLTIRCDGTCSSEENVTLEDLGLNVKPASAGVMHLKAKPEADNKHWTIDLRATPLRPGRSYRLSIHGVVFTFQTMAALTPDDDGLPVLTISQGGVVYRVLSFLQPDVLDHFPAAQREWKRGARNAASCPADTCEIVALSPSATWSSLAPRVPHGKTDGVLTAMLDLEDESALELMQLSPSFRIVTMPPETTLIGRAAPALGTDFGGDLGYNAVVDGTPNPGLTRVLMRPEWLGETVHTFEAELISSGDDPLPALNAPSTTMKFVRGAPLRATLNNGWLQYFVTDDRENINVGPSYRAYPEYNRTGKIFGDIPIRDLWTNPRSLTAFLLQLVRKGTNADIAVLDDLAVDDSIPGWLEIELSKGPRSIAYLSGFMLERAMFRPSRVVRVTVPGSQVAVYLGKIVNAAKSFDAEVFMSGIGSNGAAVNRIDGHTLKINEREIVAGHFYSIALPQRYALEMNESREEHPLELSVLMKEANKALGEAKEEGGVVTLCVTRAEGDPDCPIVPRDPAPSPDIPEGSLAIDLEKSRAGEVRKLLLLGKASIEASGLRSNETSDLALSAVPEDGRDGTRFENFAASFALEPVLSWRNGILLSMPTAADYSHKQVGADPVKETYPANSWSTALKLAKTVHSLPRLHSFFGSLGVASNFKRTTKAVTAATTAGVPVTTGVGSSATTAVTTTSIKLTPTGFPGPPRDFTMTAGIELEDAAKGKAKLTGMSVGWTNVHRRRDLVGLVASGSDISADELAADSAQAIINALFKKSPDVVRNDPTVKYTFGNTRFSRMDVAATGSVAFRQDTWLPTSISLENKYRFYFHGGTPRLIAARQTLETKLKWTTRLIRRWEVAPYLSAFWLKLRNDGRTFRLFEYGVKFQFPLFEAWGPGRAYK